MMKRLLQVLGVLLVVSAAWWAGFFYARKAAPGLAKGTIGAKKPAVGYHCPMHPNFRSDHPGNCGICGMKLVPDEAGTTAGQNSGEPAARILFYRDPQHPDYTSAEPGKSRESGNELVPVYENQPDSFAPGAVRVTPERRQMIGVKLGQVAWLNENSETRAVGKVAVDERRVSTVQARVDGWVQHVDADFTGKLVRRGERLLTLYSPELFAAQQEYLLALRNQEQMRRSSLPETRTQSEALLEAAKRRLELLDFDDVQLERLTRERKAQTETVLFAGESGYVLTRNAFPKQRITAETELYRLADLSHVWIQADVFEADAAAIRIGARAMVRSPLTGRSFPADVTYIQPELDPQTRTLKVRLEAENPSLSLRPETFVDVLFRTGGARRLAVPREAVLDSGEQQTVFVDLGEGYFEPRHVRTGARFGDSVEILSGLRAGETIVVSEAFLVDSESRLRSVSAQMGAPSSDATSRAPAASPGKDAGRPGGSDGLHHD